MSPPPQKKRIIPWKNHNHEWNCKNLGEGAGGGERKSILFLSGMEEGVEITWGRELPSRWHPRMFPTSELPLKGHGWQLRDIFMKARNKAPGDPWVPQHWWAWCVRLQAWGPWDDGQRPRAAASLDRKNSTSVNSAAESSGWPQKDSEKAVLELHTETCRFPEPILWSQSLLPTSEY